MVQRCKNHGEELVVARRMMAEATKVLGPRRPELWLLDALYFNVNTIKIAREQRAHVVFKFKEADYRAVTADAHNLFQHFGGDEELSGWDEQRGCRWKVRRRLRHPRPDGADGLRAARPQQLQLPQPPI